MFIGFCYESIKSFLGSNNTNKLCKTNKIFNFLRHCRNAAFHNNKILLI